MLSILVDNIIPSSGCYDGGGVSGLLGGNSVWRVGSNPTSVTTRDGQNRNREAQTATAVHCAVFVAHTIT